MFKVEKRYGKQAGQWQIKQRISGKKNPVPIPRSSWPVGLSPSLSFEEAKKVVASINASEQLQKEAAHETGVKRRLRAATERVSAWLPFDIVSHFERIFIEPRKERPAFAKLESQWALVQRLVIDLNLDPSDWALEPAPIYEWWTRHPRSLDYIRRCLKLLNKYGHLYCRKRGAAFSPVPPPPEPWAGQICEGFEERGLEKRSLPLLEEQLQELRALLPPAQMLWVELAWAFGLRPEEVDLLSQEKLDHKGHTVWAIEESSVLLVYQPKLRRVPRRERYKRIPAFTELQRRLLTKLTRQPVLKRPSIKIVRHNFPEGVTLYGCRHGFTRYMEERGQPMEKVSKWLGHRSIKTTERYYRDHGLLAIPDKELG